VNIIQRLLALHADQRGVTALEYGLICALILLVAMISFASFTTSLSATLTSVAESL
jgi:Flp pilus assembly pilin Flp